MLTTRSMRIANTATEGSMIYMGAQSEFAIGADAEDTFLIQKASMTRPLLALDTKGTLRFGADHLQALNLNVVGDFMLGGVRQWRLAQSDDFSGWSRLEVSRCAGVTMLGGYCKFSRGEVNKTFAALPAHDQLRVVARFHFIDRWVGEAGYLKLNIGEGGEPVVVWSEQHSQEEATNGISLCGHERTPEGKFSVPIDVVVPHRKAAVQLFFGSTMDDSDPCDESWGVSGVELYTRSG